MNLSAPSILMLTTALVSLSSCVTTPSALQMREANSALRQSEKKAAQGDFPGADTAAAAIGRNVRSGVNLAPIVQSKAGQPVNLKPMLNAWESGPYQDLKKALKSGQGKSARTAFANLRGQCTNCHAAIGRPSIRID